MSPKPPPVGRIPAAWNSRIDFVGPMAITLGLAGLLCLVSLGLCATVGLNFGTDFAGGYELQVQFDREVSEGQIRDHLAPAHLGDARVQRFGGVEEHQVLIMVRGQSSGLSAAKAAQLRAQVAALTPDQPLSAWALADSGESLQVAFASPLDPDRLRAAIAAAGLQVAHLQAGQRSDRPEYVVRLAGVADRAAAALVAGMGGDAASAQVKRVDFVGPQVGAQLRVQGLMAVVYALFFIFLYVAVRFDMFFSPGAILATLHDVIITMGILSAFQVEFTLNVVAALLTLIGFSLNDTIVVYDRIRENVASQPGLSLAVQVNRSINETLSRTVLTSGTVVLVTVALLALGGPFLHGLALTMLVGVVVGTYSSIAVAAPLYMLLRRRFAGRPQPAATGRGAPALS